MKRHLANNFLKVASEHLKLESAVQDECKERFPVTQAGLVFQRSYAFYLVVRMTN